jgi:hypothetical protein
MKMIIPKAFSDVGLVDKVVFSNSNKIRVYPKSKGVGVQLFIKK